MFKLLLSHVAIEKAIDVLFQKIFNNFPINYQRYKKIFVKHKSDIDGEITMVVLYNVELTSSPDDPDTYMVRFEYFKYSHIECNWLNEKLLSSSVKSLSHNEWCDVKKTFVIKKIR